MDTVNAGKVSEWIESRWESPHCTLCKSNAWQLGEIGQIPEFIPGGPLMIGGSIVPIVPVICTYCGNTVLLNAVVIGLDLSGSLRSTEGAFSAEGVS